MSLLLLWSDNFLKDRVARCIGHTTFAKSGLGADGTDTEKGIDR